MLDIFETQKKLVAAALPSGLEGAQAAVIRELAAPYCDEVYTDAPGNLICRKKGAGKKLMLPAHMDVIGFMATFIDERGFVRFAPVGGHGAAFLHNAPVRFENGVFGCIRADLRAKCGETPLCDASCENLYIDIGAHDENEARQLVHPGLCAVFATEPIMQGESLITPYADNLVGCAVLLSALSAVDCSENDLYFVFTVQEELGLRGAKTAANAIAPYMGIALDLTRTGDSPAEADNARMAVKLGGGPAIKLRDSSLICDRAAVAHLRDCAEREGIKYQDEILPAGGTDSAAMQRARTGVLSCCVSLPGRNIHTPSEIININDARRAALLLAAAAKTEI